ncbi:hypothetical protein P175DRAFT_0493592 [Aspergillus ochraceoroseus IBT 24754]|uniref:TNT domain-containing protein n=3 Tax=Aspergillus subgen. Nidulantes TaxID=2720870 RepID=A0A0F8WRI5_9EURO|nr:uncharacterized protein P175DRAFT_0493592 [Aspergillus ochraceoroseus IBT 24754]KKK20255.1 hypothetical protein ARAM_004105 [Aspergillus rambellii]KKK23284.1 hypothetical protein AOCH_007344 [Aspergillus ochraceoroseus]PTU19769.1 hypothetical protein P175DRAFT_0493592 [Aspergillus ochraceoroseus IBT 24754]
MHLAAFTLLLAAVAVADPSSVVTLRKTRPSEEPSLPDRCNPDPCKGITFQNETAVCGDPRLGPIKLPKYFPLSTELQTYARFGDLCPYEFLAKWSTSVSDPDASYIYPYDNGFANDTAEVPIYGNVTLVVGQRLDRFGSERGNFLSPLGAPYIERALPPWNLFAPENSSFPYNYHVYEVIQEFDVLLGPITPWFQQPGYGTQFMVKTNVSDLVDNEFLRALELKEYDDAEDFAANYLPPPPHPSS